MATPNHAHFFKSQLFHTYTTLRSLGATWQYIICIVIMVTENNKKYGNTHFVMEHIQLSLL